MTLNTIKTFIGFFITMIRKYTKLSLSSDSLEGIYNFLAISDLIATSGQPTEKQLLLIKQAGYQSIINLAPHHAENSLADEALTLSQLGLKYTHIPVDFNNPTNEDFKKFIESMKAASSEKIWVHCAANMRVSAFIYKYRCDILNEDIDKARSDLAKIWEPFGVWKQFIATT